LVCPHTADPHVVEVAPVLLPFKQIPPDAGIAIGVAFKQSSFNGWATTTACATNSNNHKGISLYIV
jgi:hypothetical protein